MGYKIPGVGESATGIVTLINPLLIGIMRLVSGTITHTLPPVADSQGKFITFKKTDSNATTVTIDGYGSETIDGQTTIQLTEQYEVVRIYCNGLAWYIV